MTEERDRLNQQAEQALGSILELLGNNRELREDQLHMTRFLLRYLEFADAPGHVAMVEAGTGIGKTFAYLTAICEYLKEHSTERFIIATNTLTLMDQLANKDIPLVSQVYPDLKFRFAKGRHNYLCLNKFYQLIDSLFSDETDSNLAKIEDQLEESTGERSDLPDMEDNVWRRIHCDHHDCLAQDCIYYNDCFLNQARRNLKDADVIITNHALSLIDILQKPVFPNNTHILFDEAHNLESNAVNALTVMINDNRIQQMHQLLEEAEESGYFSDIHTPFNEWKQKLLMLSAYFFGNFDEDGRDLDPDIYEDGFELLKHMEKYYNELSSKRERSNDDDEEDISVSNFYYDLEEICNDLKVWLTQSNTNSVYWHERGSCYYAPIDLSRELFPLWDKRNAILVSATLTVRKKFDNIIDQLGLPKENTYTLRLDSPFPYDQNALIYCPKNAPSPKVSMDYYTSYVTDVVISLLDEMEGHVFILFTSYRMLNDVFERCEDEFGDRFDWIVQGKGTKEKLLQSYRNSDKAVLFGTDSYWEGVDEEIDCLIIAKLPFAVPTTPFEQARSEYIENNDGNPFMSLSLPKCALKLKQGVGRLIRRQDKKGIIVFCDPRIVRTYWGKVIIETLPNMRWTDDLKETLRFYRELHSQNS